MAGVEILYSEPIMEPGIFFNVAVVFVVIAFGVFVAGRIAEENYYNKKITKILHILIFIAVGAAIGFGVADSSHQVESDRYRYEVIVLEEASITEFYKKYEIIEQRGEIWVIEDKEE